MRTTPIWMGTAALGAVLVSALVAACTPTGQATPTPSTGSPTADPTAAPAAFAVAVGPKDGTKNLPVSTELGLSVVGGQIVSVAMTAAGTTAKIPGRLRTDGSSWVPDTPLSFATAYTATVTAVSTDGATVTSRTTSFTTMRRPARITGTGLYLFDRQSVGVAMPVVIEFHPPIPVSARAGIQKRLFVVTDPPQPGAWHWASGSQVWYRAPRHWRPGTTITVRSGLAGHPTGGGAYGDVDRTATVTVGTSLALVVENATKQLNVYERGRLVRTIPVSLGKPSTPSSSGNLVVMSKESSTIFDTTDDGPGGYRVRIDFALRLTWGGEFIHAAPGRSLIRVGATSPTAA